MRRKGSFRKFNSVMSTTPPRQSVKLQDKGVHSSCDVLTARVFRYNHQLQSKRNNVYIYKCGRETSLILYSCGFDYSTSTWIIYCVFMQRYGYEIINKPFQFQFSSEICVIPHLYDAFSITVFSKILSMIFSFTR